MQVNILSLITRAIEELNLQLPPEERLTPSADTKLFGSGGSLDSLGLVNLILILEEMIESELGIAVTLVNHQGVSQAAQPFQTIKSLADYISERVGSSNKQLLD